MEDPMSETPDDDAPLHDTLLPFTGAQLKQHFAPVKGEARGDPDRHLAAWRKRIADARGRPADFLDRDETMWTAGALVAVHRSAEPSAAWERLLATTFGPRPPLDEPASWQACLDGDLDLYLEVGLSSPARYREFLRAHLADRHPLRRRVESAETRRSALEGRTHLDALLLNRSKRFAVHVEAKLLSDIDTKISYDALRNQLARNLDCMLEPPRPGKEGPLAKRRPDRSLFVLLTPELFRRHWQSRLYGHLLREYRSDPAALQRDLPHRSGAECASLSRRIGWMTFEDVKAVVPDACRWLDPEPPDDRG
jgi:hypothetical protein